MKLLSNIKKFYFQKILKRKYYRFGECKKCGKCCENIYVRHLKSVIKTKEEFDEIKKANVDSFYNHIDIIGQDDFGLIFACNWFDKEKKLCKSHKKRPTICRNYPSEEIFSFGAILQPNCGYYFKPIESFNEVLNKEFKKLK